MSFDPITVINLVLSVVILISGIVLYGMKKNTMALYVGIAFGLFAISHLATLLDLASSLTVPLVVIRTLAYLVVIFALFSLRKK
jgi:hypothetical protein